LALAASIAIFTAFSMSWPSLANCPVIGATMPILISAAAAAAVMASPARAVAQASLLKETTIILSIFPCFRIRFVARNAFCLIVAEPPWADRPDFAPPSEAERQCLGPLDGLLSKHWRRAIQLNGCWPKPGRRHPDNGSP